MDLLEHFLTSVVQGANAAAHPVAFALHLGFGLTYLAHLYINRRDWACGRDTARALFFFPLRGGKRHAVFQCFAWLLWGLSTAITLPVYLSIILAGADGRTPDVAEARGLKRLHPLPGALLRALGIQHPPIPPTHIGAALGAAVVSGLWGELFLLKALLVFKGGSRLKKGSPVRGVRSSHGHSAPQHKHASSPARGSLSPGEGEGFPSGSDAPPRWRKALPSPGLAGPQQGGPSVEGGEEEKEWGLREAEDWQSAEPQRQQLLAPRLASLLVCLMGLALSFTGFVLLLALEHMPDTAMRVLYCSLALSCVFIGASSTHGLGGHLRYCAGAAGSAGAAVLRRSGSGAATAAAAAAATAAAGVAGGAAEDGGGGDGSGGEGEDGGEEEHEDDGAAAGAEGPGWRFFQPFQGGVVFVATQAIGWTLFSSTVVGVLLLAKQLVAGVGYCLRCWALAVGALMMATQLVLGLSLLTYQQRRRASKLLQPVLHHPRASLARAAGLVMPVVMMYLPLHVVCSAIAATFALLPARQAGAVVLAILLPYFAITLRGHPAHTGCRRWPWLCRWFSHEVEGSLAWWAGRLIVVRDFEGTAHDVVDELRRQTAADPSPRAVSASSGCRDPSSTAPAPDPGPTLGPGPGPRRYVLGFHPHGLYPTGAGFLPLMPSVHAAFPGTAIVTLTASIVHYLPGLRDIAGWAGFRQVTRSTFRRALHDTGAVLLCPGGQAELVYSDRAFPPRGSPGAAAAAAAAAASSSGTATATTAAAVAAAAAATAVEAAVSRAQSPLLPTQPPAAAASSGAGSAAAGAATATAVLTGEAANGAAGHPSGLPSVTPSPAPGPRPVKCPDGRHQLVIYAGHQGFVRLALEEGAWLVPVLALGEVLQLRNLISAPEMQRLTYKRLGFPVPFILAGRWGLTALPLRNPLIYVLGRPLQPPPGWEHERSRQLALQLQDGHQHHHHLHYHQQHQHNHDQRHRKHNHGHDGHDQEHVPIPQQEEGEEGVAGQPAAGAAGAAGLRRRLQQPKTRSSSGGGVAPAPAVASKPLPPGRWPPVAARPSTSGAAGLCCGPGVSGGGVVVPQEVVDEYHLRFYEELGSLWKHYRHLHPVLRHAELVFDWGHHTARERGGEQPGVEGDSDGEGG